MMVNMCKNENTRIICCFFLFVFVPTMSAKAHTFLCPATNVLVLMPHVHDTFFFMRDMNVQ
jgi:hypothetical protein